MPLRPKILNNDGMARRSQMRWIGMMVSLQHSLLCIHQTSWFGLASLFDIRALEVLQAPAQSDGLMLPDGVRHSECGPKCALVSTGP
mmetsp:Transcript_18856/g.56976  ORF Transcript_18856/g.56976 Transcript_18856/m.56976 type:complete len:87 (+) Transcript_18856:1393-1653(+)